MKSYKDLKNLTYEELGIKNNKDKEKIFKILQKNRQLLFIMDGLNEVGNIINKTKDLVRIINLQSLKESKFLITCRTYEYQHIAAHYFNDFLALEIKDLTQADLQSYINDKFKENTQLKEKMHDAILENKVIRKICSNPFIFLMVIKLIYDNKTAPDTISELYNTFLIKFIRDWEQSKKKLPTKRRILENIAYEMKCASKSLVEMDFYELKKIASNTIKNIELDELFNNGFLIKNGSNVKFFQETFQEYLVASWLIRNKIYPKEFRIDKYLEYKDLIISTQAENFYFEMTGIKKMIECRTRVEWKGADE